MINKKIKYNPLLTERIVKNYCCDFDQKTERENILATWEDSMDRFQELLTLYIKDHQSKYEHKREKGNYLEKGKLCKSIYSHTSKIPADERFKPSVMPLSRWGVYIFCIYLIKIHKHQLATKRKYAHIIMEWHKTCD